ncbi:MAG: hypothetical protein QJT81_11170 [Candidatus Thiothrix putei]|uniref:Uncharacterized protein n=1 Tax=Candidatus Thiothrix putei TaxID=3080811 RepID=A0AA95HAG9_9GAMM|nr:MAG: hypothetical protein QJT81_11170 [Candidatus Thiothrix putei]
MPDLFISYAHVDKHWVDADHTSKRIACRASSYRCDFLPPLQKGGWGDFLQQKRAALEQRRTLLLDLLTRQQEELTFADDPKRQMKLERDIRTTQASLAQVESEIR